MSVKDIIFESIDKQGVAILPPMDVFDSINLLKTEQIHVACTMLDPWYNKGKAMYYLPMNMTLLYSSCWKIPEKYQTCYIFGDSRK